MPFLQLNFLSVFSIPEGATLTTKDFRFYEGEDDIIGKTPVSVSYSDGIVTINLGNLKYLVLASHWSGLIKKQLL